jgi:hypothetical protein
MFKDTHSAADLMRGLLTPAPKEIKGKYIMDDADEGDEAGPASDYAGQQMRVTAASIAQQFAATDDLGDDESLAVRLMMLVVGAVDADIDGELSEDESAVAEILLNYMWDYLSLKGVSDDDASALLNDWDADAAGRVKDLLAEELSGDDEAAAEDIDSFAFDEESSSAIFDSANGEILYDAVYKKKIVIKNGRKTKINKRISGNVRLNAKQKIAVRKMQRKSHTATATLKRVKSMRKRTQAGL